MIKTQRLTLRPQQLGDAPALFQILSDAEAMRFWSRPPLARLAVAEELVREQQVAMAEGICRYWTIVEGAGVIGSVDLSLIRDGSAEMGFLLHRDRWNLGLASEAVAAVTAHAFGSLRLERLASAIQAGNLAAARVLEKTGFLPVDRRQATIASGDRRDCIFYLLRRGQSAPPNGGNSRAWPIC